MAIVLVFPQTESPADHQDDMKLTADDKRWLNGEIKTQIANGLKEFGDSLKPHGWRKLTFWLREWGLIGTAIAVPVTLLGFLITVSIFAGVGIKENSKFQGATETRLTNIESQLRTLNASRAPKKVLEEIANLDPKQFAQNLPALRKVSEQPVASVSPTPATLEKVAYQLKSVDENTDDYWPTVLRFIQFASAGLASNTPAPGSRPLISYKDLTLNGGLPTGTDHVIVQFDRVGLANVTFTNSRIIFTSNPSTFMNVRFINCAFEFPDTNSPSPSLKKTGELLLSSGLTSAYVPSA
jgi:hypothetical protein